MSHKTGPSVEEEKNHKSNVRVEIWLSFREKKSRNFLKMKVYRGEKLKIC